MLLALIGIAVGIAVGIFLPWIVTPSSTVYVAAAILAALDSVFGGMNAFVTKSFNMAIFVSGLICNAFLAVIIIFLGEKIGIDLYLAVVVVFGTRIFSNFAAIRHHIIIEMTNRHQKKQSEEQVTEEEKN